MTRPRIAVIGAGIVGLSTTSHLVDLDVDVRCYEQTAPGSAQSRGRTRIFRCAHGDTRLVELARRAHEGWRRWEKRFGKRLIGGEGLIVTGESIVPAWQHAMENASTRCLPLDSTGFLELLPIGKVPDCPSLLDPWGGATRVRRTIDMLTAHAGSHLRIAQVHDIQQGGEGCTIHASGGDWECDEVVITAGVDTSRLATPLGAGMPVNLQLHSRFTFAIKDDYRNQPLSCWIDDSGKVDGIHAYCQPVGTTGEYAVGVSWPDQRCDVEVGEEEVSRQSLAKAVHYVQEALPGLHPEPTDEVRCTSNDFGFDGHGDGFMGLHQGNVTALYGNNLFKFAPLLGELLTDGALRCRLPAELTMHPAPPHSLPIPVAAPETR